MRKLLPHPGLSVLLLVIWLLENNSIAPGHILLGSFLALVIPLVVDRFFPEPIRIFHPILVSKYLGRLILDIFTANLQVALWITQPNHKLKPVFINYELEVKSPLGISVLANTISLTPGTVSCDVSPDQRFLLIHCLHADDPEEVIQEISQRYEKPLIEALSS